ncbi:alternate-type signal peptide domain-containing protein [Arthrobacter psychrolactophilus]
MNKMAKGAIATGVGIILLAGGGGTLATWNQAQNASMGTVVAGDLNLAPASAGVWTNASGTVVTVANYKVVPGDTLTYTQPLNVKLVGDLMVAKLTVTGASAADGFGTNAVVSATTLKKSDDTVVSATSDLHPSDTGVVTASTTFTFKKSTAGLDATKASVDLSGIGYKLEQQAPVASNNS